MDASFVQGLRETSAVEEAASLQAPGLLAPAGSNAAAQRLERPSAATPTGDQLLLQEDDDGGPGFGAASLLASLQAEAVAEPSVDMLAQDLGGPAAAGRLRATVPDPDVEAGDEADEPPSFELGPRTPRTCKRCGISYEERVPCCPHCQGELHGTVAVKMVKCQRAGWVLSKEADGVDFTATAQTTLETRPEPFVFLRKAAQPVKYSDLLSLNSASRAGYATVKSQGML